MPINPDAVLAFVDILNHRPEQIGVHIHSRICLKDAEVLVWLAGDTRTLRSDAWIQFNELPERASSRSDYQQFRDSIEGRDISTGLIPYHENYLQIERMVKKMLPSHFINRRIWAGELAEWNVIVPAPEIKAPAVKTRRTKPAPGTDKPAQSDVQKAVREK